ncbi:DNA-binding transcriptional regulator, LysR family [Andreprevotia lacus DSM 23236]|jgi:DNA-binding transcriptional LysR family regulator|uniref:DNA-binding transcriptional regulator, LysR family n=1 Tax=Andreprevotia lacus DSM 23236 TaxID=1121001 RepID=A0A1W1WYG0_9NEIS|nr:LysR family transcriptional regulator [Andreprevotia lacus]SMC16151.1 DNA-binding transcriptional regulator, LysR family [Andreprevotia lacus DSM 23236]
MDKLTSMAVFVQVAEKGSFAAVADGFGLSTTMIANHVRALESELGAKLIVRTTRRHHLTEVGQLYLARCRDVLASVAMADRVGDTLRAEPQGTVRMTAPVTYGAHKLVPVLGAYMARHPQVKVELVLSDQVADLVEQGFELAIRSGEIDAGPLVARALHQSTMLAVASPAYLQRHGTPQHPAELVEHDCLGFMAWGREPVWRFSRGEETAHIPVQGRMRTNNGQALRAAALAGMGIVVQADVLLEDDIASGRLVHLLPDWALPARTIYLLRTRDLQPTPKLRSLIDFLVVHLGGRPAVAGDDFVD